jgi:hypothetical protein
LLFLKELNIPFIFVSLTLVVLKLNKLKLKTIRVEQVLFFNVELSLKFEYSKNASAQEKSRGYQSV